MNEKKVRNRLARGIYVAEMPRKGERLTSQVYNVIHVIYNVHTKERVLHWYRCCECSKILNVNLTRNGNAQLTRHKCYNNWLLKNTDQQESEESDEDSIDDPFEENEQHLVSEQNATQ